VHVVRRLDDVSAPTGSRSVPSDVALVLRLRALCWRGPSSTLCSAYALLSLGGVRARLLASVAMPLVSPAVLRCLLLDWMDRIPLHRPCRSSAYYCITVYVFTPIMHTPLLARPHELALSWLSPAPTPAPFPDASPAAARRFISYDSRFRFYDFTSCCPPTTPSASVRAGSGASHYARQNERLLMLPLGAL